MKEIVVTQYMAEDGTTFSTKEKCLAHEEKCKEIPELRKALRRVKELCNNMDCRFCPFSDDDDNCCFPSVAHTPEEWDIPED